MNRRNFLRIVTITIPGLAFDSWHTLPPEHKTTPTRASGAFTIGYSHIGDHHGV